MNGLDTPWGKQDMAAATAVRPDAILVPKVSSATDVIHAAALSGGHPLWVMIETPLAILNLKEIGEAARAARLTCLVLGTNDLLKETRMKGSDARAALVPALSQAVLAARAFGLDCIDGVYNDFKDETGFTPAESETAWARKIMEAFALPENAAKGVITVDGRMVERLHLAMAERSDAIARAVAP